MKSTILSLMLFLMAPIAAADRCEDLAKPKEFNKETAMEAIFCEYNREHGGTLIPRKNTALWNAKNAEILATPILAATYRENGERKGVLAVQRQMLGSTGEPVMSHAQTAIISVYVFNYDGSKWSFEKGKMAVSDSGAHGFAPGGRLARLGPEKYGLWFEGGDIHQGYTNDYAFIISLSDQKVLKTGIFDTGQSNSGGCADAPTDRGILGGACWAYEGKPEFIKAEGFDYYMLRIAYQGTEQTDINNRDKIIPKNEPVCYIYSGDKYIEAKDKRCAAYEALEDHDIFNVGDKEEWKQPIPTLPRKLIK